jgi:hypothetical protein
MKIAHHRALATAVLVLLAALPARAYCPFSSPILQGGILEGPTGSLILPDPEAALGGFLWELGHGDPADGVGNDTDSSVSGYPVGPGDAPWIRRDLVPASIDWDWFFYGTDGCLSGGAGAGVVVAFVLDDAPDGPHYALMAVSGTTEPDTAHDFDRINTGGGDAGNLVPLEPLALLPKLLSIVDVDGTHASLDVGPALASVNVHDDLAGAGPYAGLVDLSSVTGLLHRAPGGGDETFIPDCLDGCYDVLVPMDREVCWAGSAAAVGHTVIGDSFCEGGVMDGFPCDPERTDDACVLLDGACVTEDPVPVPMGPVIPGGCVLVERPQDLDADGFPSTSDCDDTNPAIYPGAAQFCDGLNNDCDHPAWPAPPGAECFAITNLRVSTTAEGVRLDWDVPATGADSYQVFGGQQAEMEAGDNAGALLTTVASPTVELIGTPASGSFFFFLVAGTLDGVQGSLGQDSQGVERRPTVP